MRTKTITYNKNNIERSNAANNVYGGGKYKIRESKTVTVDTPRRHKTKVVTYGPINQFGRQKKTKVKTITKK